MMAQPSPEPSLRGVSTLLAASAERRRLYVRGVVQGVGFRPFVYGLANRLGLGGTVRNDSAGVIIEIEGDLAALAAFERELIEHAPPLARIDHVSTTVLPTTGEQSFTIIQSQSGVSESTLISPDLSICDDCLRELFDPLDRRFRYPFVNCTNCGPRFTIIQDIPYDRPLTTMSSFSLCPECRREYEDPNDRRFHAQPNACPHCGPQLEFRWVRSIVPPHLVHLSDDAGSTTSRREQALCLAQRVLANGGIVAIKGVGGFHLACDATNDHAVQALRRRKGRMDKPFAVMVRDLDVVCSIAYAGDAELDLLASRERPIVLLQKRLVSPLTEQVAPGNPCVGVMLPYSPLHYLLFEALGDESAPPSILVMTSGNHASEAIVTGCDEAQDRLSSLADAFLMHDRTIHVPCDDSVMRVFEDRILPIRRSRGFAPLPVKLPFALRPTLAVGGELKNAFCLAKHEHAFLSQHIGDMQNLETLEAFERAVDHMQALFRIKPEVVVCDMHPNYLSTHWAEEDGYAETLIKVQHHHAHIASVMAEHGLDGSELVIGFAFDGTGYGIGPRGLPAIWGGEILIADYLGFRRATYLDYFPLPGSDSAIRHPRRTALAALWAAGIEWNESLPPVVACSETERGVLRRQFETGVATVPTSSMGRLFDATASLVGVCQTASYEAQAAIEFEALVDQKVKDDEKDTYRFTLPTAFGSPFDAAPVLHRIVDDVRAGVAPSVIATRFHSAVADLIFELSLWLRACEGLNNVALSGGVFQNLSLLQRTVKRLRAAGFNVLTHRLVPPNDGGLALGQAILGGLSFTDESIYHFKRHVP